MAVGGCASAGGRGRETSPGVSPGEGRDEPARPSGRLFVFIDFARFVWHPSELAPSQDAGQGVEAADDALQFDRRPLAGEFEIDGFALHGPKAAEHTCSMVPCSTMSRGAKRWKYWRGMS